MENTGEEIEDEIRAPHFDLVIGVQLRSAFNEYKIYF